MSQRRKEALKSICKDWYMDPSLPGNWSTNWPKWHLIHFWRDRTRDGQLKIHKLFKEIWQLPGTVEPLAYIAGGDGQYFLFTAGGRYYFYADEVLTAHSMDSGSAREFVNYALKAEGSKGGGHCNGYCFRASAAGFDSNSDASETRQ
ncbi:hypothetical protein C8R45DRAFT_1112021 [Mycena sanguinolenta]|nr:hypothetical protein C8R45DRAFT_1112021 [Mycena sanguinolenta]